MVTFDIGNVRFIHRVAAVVIKDGQILLHHGPGEPFWTLPGGRVEAGEPAEQALILEMREELGIEVRVGRLIWVVENFFREREREYHGLELYFAVTVSLEPSSLEFYGFEGHRRLTFRWFALQETPGMDIRPPFLIQGLRRLPLAPTHIVNDRR